MAKTSKKDAIGLLTEDHRKVESLVERFKKLDGGDEDEKAELVRQACMELRIHAQIEEEIFYPAAREKMSDEDMIHEATVEHDVAKQLVEELEEMTPDDELFAAKFTVLGEYVKHHVEEEENEMFPKVKKLGLDLDSLGEELALRKRELQSEMGLAE